MSRLILLSVLISTFPMFASAEGLWAVSLVRPEYEFTYAQGRKDNLKNGYGVEISRYGYGPNELGTIFALSYNSGELGSDVQSNLQVTYMLAYGVNGFLALAAGCSLYQHSLPGVNPAVGTGCKVRAITHFAQALAFHVSYLKFADFDQSTESGNLFGPPTQYNWSRQFAGIEAGLQYTF